MILLLSSSIGECLLIDRFLVLCEYSSWWMNPFQNNISPTCTIDANRPLTEEMSGRKRHIEIKSIVRSPENIMVSSVNCGFISVVRRRD